MKNLTQDARKRLLTRAARVKLSGTAKEAFERILKKHHAVGGAMSIVRGGVLEQTFTYGLARRETGEAVTTQTVFRCASVSKLVMAMGAMRLCETDMLSLDGDISAVFGFRVRNPHFPQAPITLRQLLTHTAGLSDAGGYAQGAQSLSEMLQKEENYLTHAPGTRFAYSNFGAGVAGCLMEAATGERFETLMQRLIFAPLGVNASFAPQHIAARDQIANGYHVKRFLPTRLAYDAQKIASVPLAEFNPQRDYFIAPGRMLATSAELAKLLTLFLSKDGMGVLTGESLAQMRRCQDGCGSVQNAGRGLNVAFLDDIYRPGRIYGHQGVAYGMCCELWGDPETGDGVVFQSNGVQLSRGGSLMNVGADVLALGFSLLKR